MSDHEPTGHDSGHGGRSGDWSGDGAGDSPWSAGSLLGPGTSAVVAFTLAVLVLTGQNLMSIGTQALFGELFTGSSDLATFFVTWGLSTLAPAAVSLVLARRALTAGTAAAWELVLGRAAFVLALVAAFYGVVTLVGGVLHLD